MSVKFSSDPTVEMQYLTICGFLLFLQTGFLSLQDKDDPVTRELQERNSCTFAIPYAAPDRFLADMDPSVDIFSIGCIAYEIVAGRLVQRFFCFHSLISAKILW